MIVILFSSGWSGNVICITKIEKKLRSVDQKNHDLISLKDHSIDNSNDRDLFQFWNWSQNHDLTDFVILSPALDCGDLFTNWQLNGSRDNSADTTVLCCLNFLGLQKFKWTKKTCLSSELSSAKNLFSEISLAALQICWIVYEFLI